MKLTLRIIVLVVTAVLYGASHAPLWAMDGEQKEVAAQEALTPQNTRITFDIDDVILQFPKGAIRKFFLKNLWLILKNISLAPQIRKMVKRHAGGLEYVDFFKEQRCPELAQAIEKLLHSKIVKEGMGELISELDGLGYVKDVASNMGTRDYEFYAQQKYPETFRYFKYAKVVDYGSDRRPARKPSQEYFQEYLQESGNSARTKLFIDDREENVAAARRAGFEGIQFESAQQLRGELIRRGIALRPSLSKKPSHARCAIL